MEIELQHEQFHTYEKIISLITDHEESLETIVPDACPDILQIFSTDGYVCLQEKKAEEGRVYLRGIAKIYVLYLPDGENGIRRLALQFPLAFYVDAEGVSAGCSVTAHIWLRRSNTKTLNPRKILSQVRLTVSLDVYREVYEKISCHAEEACITGLQQKVETCRTCTVTAVPQLHIRLEEQLAIPVGLPEADELMTEELKIAESEIKVIGNKLILKGECQLHILYRSEDQRLYTADFTLPVSLTAPIDDVTELSGCQSDLQLTELECSLAEGTGQELYLNADINAQIVLEEIRNVPVLQDLYSTQCPIQLATRSLTCMELLDSTVKSESVRQILSFDNPINQIIDAAVHCGPVKWIENGQQSGPCVKTLVSILILDENGKYQLVSDEVQTIGSLNVTKELVNSCSCSVMGDVYTAPAPGGIEIRFLINFHVQTVKNRQIPLIESAETVEKAAEEESARPSIVLRAVDTGESLWDIAKAYQTTKQDILEANELCEEEPAVGQMLMIPCR